MFIYFSGLNFIYRQPKKAIGITKQDKELTHLIKKDGMTELKRKNKKFEKAKNCLVRIASKRDFFAHLNLVQVSVFSFSFKFLLTKDKKL